MPMKSKAQEHLMQAVKHNSDFARKVGIPQSVGREFVASGRAYADGGLVMANKGYLGKTESYAAGGPVLGKVSNFMKMKDEFRDPDEGNPDADEDQLYAKSGPGAGTGEVKPPAAKGKCLPVIRPRK